MVELQGAGEAHSRKRIDTGLFAPLTDSILTRQIFDRIQ